MRCELAAPSLPRPRRPRRRRHRPRVHRIAGIFDTLTSGHLENKLFKQITPYIEPVTYTLGNVQIFVKDGGGKKQLMKNHPAMVSHISIIEQLKNHILFCPDVAHHIVNWSWRWAGGYDQDNDDDDDAMKTYSGFEDGTIFQTHPYLSKPQSNPKVIRVPLAGYGDGVEVSPILKGSDTAARSHLPPIATPLLRATAVQSTRREPWGPQHSLHVRLAPESSAELAPQS